MSEAAIKSAAPAVPDYSSLTASLTATFDSGKTRDLDWRRNQLIALERMMSERESEIIQALHDDLGKPPMESFSTEISYVTGDAVYLRKNLKRWTKKRKVPTPLVGQPGKSWVQPEPLGVVLVIGAWNYPLQLVLAGMAAAVAAGNCVVLKPSELAPATSALVAKLVPAYLDDDCIKVVEGAIPETTALLEQPFNHILYTGNGNVGRIVMAAAAKHLTPVTLELGGKSPCIVMPDANLDATAKRIAWGKFLNAGQTCIAPDYILTDADTEAKLLPLIDKHISAMFGEDPSQSESYARIVNDRHLARLSGLIDESKVAIGGQVNAETRFMAPTVMTGVTSDDAIMQEEIFGPILPIVRAESLEDAIAFIRAGDKPLAAYLFTEDSKTEDKFLQQVSCGNACLNDVLMFMTVQELPFGGVGPSGMGTYSGRNGFDTFSHLKAVMKRGWWPDLEVRYAPYTEKKFRFLRKII